MTDKTTAYWTHLADNLQAETRLFIDGQFCNAINGATFETINPANGNIIAEVASGDEADINKAVASAKAAFKSGVWSTMAPRDRMDIMERFASLVDQHNDAFALLDSLDMGKTISETSTIDIPFAAHTIKYFAETIDKIEGKVTNTEHSALHYVRRQALGVVGCITPWNYPTMMACWKTAPALAAGNSVVLKPAEQSPLSALLLAKLFVEAGGPPGVFNVVNGPGEIAGKALALHHDVAKIAFTGSNEVGKLMMIYAGQSNMKQVAAETGGKSPHIFMPDLACMDTAVEYAVNAIYANQGEVCSAGSRLLVHQDIHDEFVEKFVSLAKQSYCIGNPLDPATTMGPLVDKKQQQRVQAYISAGLALGCNMPLGSAVPESLSAGNYVQPTLFTGVTNDMTIAREEIFGPVACIIPFATASEAVELANDTDYGLAAGIWSADLNTANIMARDIDAGIVWVNCYDHGDMTQPWGGFKQSGHGRDKCFDSVLQNMQSKSVWLNLA
ncbi:aldehyde dehydrogenase family protein [Dasania marina]|uniref:aldehyde dehydrogenase family protein n=1 Tax=Dasania marina TaxID=471499 RepID=UPI0030DA694C|tara:strand:+ start:73927 stop:75426 length:1500 start_codon:yes stop_codon:yes gene_type:complete